MKKSGNILKVAFRALTRNKLHMDFMIDKLPPAHCSAPRS